MMSGDGGGDIRLWNGGGTMMRISVFRPAWPRKISSANAYHHIIWHGWFRELTVFIPSSLLVSESVGVWKRTLTLGHSK